MQIGPHSNAGRFHRRSPRIRVHFVAITALLVEPRFGRTPNLLIKGG